MLCETLQMPGTANGSTPKGKGRASAKLVKSFLDLEAKESKEASDTDFSDVEYEEVASVSKVCASSLTNN